MAQPYFPEQDRPLLILRFYLKPVLVWILLLMCSCIHSQVRKNLNDLSPAARTVLVNLMQEYITKDVIENHCSSMSDGHTMDIHNDDNFLPFHRCYIEAMEDFMIRKGYPEFVPLPAWPPNTPVPTEFRVIDPDCASAVCDIGVSSNSSQNCATPTNWVPNITRPGTLSLPIKTGSNNDLCDWPFVNGTGGFSRILEGETPNAANSNYHNSLHSTMRGAMGFFTSPSAPIFWCFHSYVDDIWKEYQCNCPNKGGKALDLYMKDSPRVTAITRDSGTEPNTDPGAMNASTDIWVRNENDGKTNFVHQNPIYSKLNYVYIRVRNRGCQTSSGTEQLMIHWSKGATNQTWPSYWNESIKTPALMGDTISVVSIPPIVAGGSTILEIQWFPPSSANYSSNSTPKLFTLLARIISVNDPMATTEGSDVAVNTRNNNNIVMKNVTVDLPPNILPLVSITEPVTGTSFIAPASINVKANASDTDGSISKVEFYNGAALIGTATASPYVFNWSNVPIGSYTLTAKAYDDQNAVTTSTAVSITVKANTLPVVSLSSPVDGAVFIEPSGLALTANASDADGGISKVEFYQGTTLLGTVNAAPYTFNWNGVAVGTYTITAKAYDDLNAVTTSTAISIRVNANSLPSVSITNPSAPVTMIAPATLTVKANASDSDGTIIKVEFYDGSNLLETVYTSPYSLVLTALPAGVYTLSAKVFDDLNGSKASAAVTLTVNTNSLPTVSITSPSDGATLIAPANVALKATAADSDGNISKVEFYDGNSLLGTDISAPFTFDWNNVATGNYTLTAKAYDDLNAVTTSAVINLIVKTNNLPVVSINSPVDGSTLIAPVSISIKASASDGDGSISKVEFYNGSNLLGTLASSPYVFNWNTIPVGTYALTAKAYDDLNANSTSAVVHLTVNDNNPPAVSITSPPDGSSLIAPATINIKANATDTDGNISKVEFYNGGNLLGTVTNSPYTFDWVNVVSGTYVVTAKAYDDLNAVTTSTSVNLTIHDNILPTVNITAPANGSIGIAPANFVIKASASDSDGSISKVEFYEGTTLLHTATTLPYTYNWNNVSSGTYTLTAKAYDDLNGVQTSGIVTVTVNLNTLPAVSITSPPSGTTAVAPATIILKANATDADGNISKVEFYSGSTLLGEDLTSPYTFDWNAIPAGTYLISAKAIDDLGASIISATISITVNTNNPPVVSITEPLNGTTATAPANLFIKATASDNDGNISKVEFYSGSTLLGEDNTSPYTYSWNAVPAGNYTLTAKAIDNLNAVTTSASIAVTVNANILPAVQITEPANGASFISPASFTIKANATDSDGSISKVEFYNGATLLGSSITSPYTFDLTNVGAGTYTFTAKAYDNLNAVNSSSVITVTVAGNQIPLADITYPVNNEIFMAPSNITIEASASDSDGTIGKVEFYEGANLLGTDATSPYTFDWIGVSEGIYQLTVKAYDNVNAVATSKEITIHVDSNTPPQVNITAPLNGITFASPATVNIEADASDADGTISKIEFYNGATLLGTGNSVPFHYTWTGVTVGDYKIIAKAFDDGNSVTFSDTVTFHVVINDAPAVTILQPVNGASLIAPANVAIQANATDGDGSITKVEFYEGSTFLGEDLSSPFTFDWTAVPTGNYTLTAKAFDNLNVSTLSAAVNISVKDNSLPSVTIVNPVNGTIGIAPANFVIKANATDADGPVAKVEFYNGGTLLGEDLTSPYTFDWNAIPPGSYTLTAKAYDEQNAATISSAISITINPNQLPSVAITSPLTGATIITPANITLKANANDNDGSITKVEFYNGATLIGTSTSSPYLFDWNSVPIGTYTITAKAYDDLNGSTTSAAITLTVKDNSAPTTIITSPVNGTQAISPANFTIKANANDSDGTVDKVEFYSGSVLLGTATAAPYVFNWNNVTTGVYALTVKAYDNLNAVETSAVVTLTVKDNALPSIVITSPLNGSSGIAPASITIKANANDTDGSIAKIEFYNGSTLLGTSTAAPYTFDWNMIPVGVYTLTAKAYDDLNAVETSGPVTVTIKDNAAPTITLTEPLSGTTEISPANFVIKANAADSDGSISKVEFYNGASLLGTDVNSPYTLDWFNVPSGVYTLTARAYDDLNAVTTSGDVIVTIKDNLLPTVSIASPVNGTTTISPANFTIKVNASDDDGGISKVEFFAGSTLLHTDVNSPYTYDWNAVPAGVYLLTAKAYDNLNAVSTSAEIKITVNANVPPSISIITPVNGANAIEPATVSIKANAVDNDGSISRVEFYTGASLLATLTTSPYTYDWANIPAGTYTLTARAYDDLNAFSVSPEVKLTVTANSLPVVHITSPVTNTTLLAPANVVIKAAAYDNDGSISKVEFYTGTTFLGEDLSSPYQFDWNAVPAGDYIITVKAFDNLNAFTVSDNITIHVLNNTLPVVSITSPLNEAMFMPPATIDITASASDVNGSISKVEFYSENTLLGTVLSSPYTFQWSNVPLGDYKLTAIAYDNLDATGVSDTVTVMVHENMKPMVMITKPYDDDYFNLPADVLILAHASDHDGMIMKVEFYQNWVLLGDDHMSPYEFEWKNVPTGVYQLTAVAYDDMGVMDTSSVKIMVDSNLLPITEITTPSSGDVFSASSDIRIAATASDLNGTVQRVDFYYDNTLIDSDTTDPYEATWKNVPAGSYRLVAEAHDDMNGRGYSDDVLITIVNNPAPTVSLTSPSNGDNFITGDHINLSAIAQDDGSIQRVDFYRGKILIASDSTSPYTARWENAAQGHYLLTAKAYDNLGIAGVSTNVNINVKNNDPPAVLLITPADNSIYTAPTDIQLEADAQDMNGSIAYVEFYVDAILLASDSTAPYLFTWKNVGIGTHAIKAKAFDNLNASAESSVATITIENNQFPIVTITSPNDGDIFNAPALIVIAADAKDNNGSIARVDFYRGNALIASDSTSPYSYTWKDVPPGNYILTAKAVDNLNAMNTSPETKITVKDIPTGIHQQTYELTDVTLYPVPFDSKVTLKFTALVADQLLIKLYNETGKEIFALHQKVVRGEQVIDIDGTLLPSGLYFITLQTSTQLLKKKLLKLDTR